ncbi:MAG: cytochrome c biogenesis protein CcsA [Phycisphaerae bacterium]|nr:cytochrome c biogenesis protein CcsA [Phycisphaerae bacterium]
MRRLLLILSFIFLVSSVWFSLSYDGQCDPLYLNIIYLHVPSSICALLCFCIVLIGGIGYLATKKLSFDYLAAAAAEAGLIFATVLNATGCIFSKIAWNTWWTPSPRLITSAILWFLYIAYLILRSSIPATRKKAQICAVFGIIAFLDVPLVYISARLMPDIHKPNFSFDNPEQKLAFASGLIGTFLLASALIWLRYDVFQCQSKLQKHLL